MRIIPMLLSISILGLSCTKEPITNYEAYIINATKENIEVRFYKSGIVNPEDTLLVSPNQTVQIAEGFDRDISHKAGFSSKYFGIPGDSIIVVFNDSFIVSHYSNTPNRLSDKYLLFSSVRNIGNPKSYEYKYEDENKNIRNTTYTYTFTEDDYNFAKN